MKLLLRSRSSTDKVSNIRNEDFGYSPKTVNDFYKSSILCS